MKILPLVFLLSATAFGSLPARSQEAPAGNWFKVDQAVAEDLMTSDIEAVKARAVSARADTPDALLRRFDLLERAGDRDAASAMAAPLASRLSVGALSSVIDVLIGRQDWKTAVALMTQQPRAMTAGRAALIQYLTRPEQRTSADAWLVRQAQAAPWWVDIRVQVRAKLGTADTLLAEMADDVRAHPEDLARAENYLRAVRTVGAKTDVGWMGTACRPRLALERLELGQQLRDARAWDAAVMQLQAAQVTPLTDDDYALQRKDSQAVIPRKEFERTFSASVTWLIAEIRQAQGQPKEAARLFASASRIWPDGIPPLGLASQVGEAQQASETFVVGDRIQRAAATPAAKDADYWLARADYYQGRGDRAAALDACRQAISLTSSVSDPQNPNYFPRLQPIDKYAFILWRTDTDPRTGGQEAIAFLLKQFDAATPGTGYARALLREIAFSELSSEEVTAHLLSVDPNLWTHLRACRGWGDSGGELRAFWNVARYAPTSQARGVIWSRLEAMAHGADPSRAATLGWAMTRTQASARAIPLLRDALKRMPMEPPAGTAPTPTIRDSVAFNLLEAYLDTNDWRGADAIWAQARRELGPGEFQSWRGRIAVCAMHASASEDALRLWRSTANLDLMYLGPLAKLADAGLRGRLVSWYQRLRAEDPDSVAPAAALTVLQGHS